MGWLSRVGMGLATGGFSEIPGLMKDLTKPSGGGIDTTSFPGSFGAGPDSARLSKLMESLITGTQPYATSLNNELMNPTYGATNPNESALLDSLTSLTQGTSALRGLGPSTPGGLAQVLAPELVNLRQQRVNNLMQAMGSQATNLSGLNELIGLSMPQNVAMQRPQGPSTLQQISQLMGIAGGAAKMFA